MLLSQHVATSLWSLISLFVIFCHYTSLSYQPQREGKCLLFIFIALARDLHLVAFSKGGLENECSDHISAIYNADCHQRLPFRPCLECTLFLNFQMSGTVGPLLCLLNKQFPKLVDSYFFPSISSISNSVEGPGEHHCIFECSWQTASPPTITDPRIPPSFPDSRIRRNFSCS